MPVPDYQTLMRGASVGIALAGFAFAPLVARGQAPAKLEFEVAAVRPVSAPARFGGRINGGPGSADPERITYTGVPMIRLLMAAYGIPIGSGSPLRPAGAFSDQILGPPWIESEWYDISAKVPAGTTQQQVNGMLQNLLAERFGLKLHHETRELSGYELVVSKSGSKLKPTSDPNAQPPVGSVKRVLGEVGFLVVPQGVRATLFSAVDDTGTMRVTGQSQSISDLIVAVIATSLNDGKRVVDRTGLTGRFDFKMDLDGGGGFRRPGLGPRPVDDPTGPDIFTALDKSLGLKLQKAQIPIDELVIDQLEKTPSEN